MNISDLNQLRQNAIKAEQENDVPTLAAICGLLIGIFEKKECNSEGCKCKESK